MSADNDGSCVAGLNGNATPYAALLYCNVFDLN